MLPTISDALILDGWTQGAAGYTGPPLIEINGNGTAAGTVGFTITASDSTLRGLVINRFPNDAIRIMPGGDRNTIVGNYIGTDVTGMLDLGNGNEGVEIQGADNVVGGAAADDRNVISGNAQDGISITGVAATGNQVQGNYIGVNVNADAAIANNMEGIRIDGDASGNTIGGAGVGNVVSGNTLDGIRISGAGSDGNVVQGNYIGVNASGDATIGNSQEGILIDGGASGNTIGGVGAGNIVAGNTWGGIRIRDAGSDGNIVQGNWFGTNAAGDVLGQGYGNVEFDHGASNNLIGGVNAGEANVIAYADDDGVFMYSGGTDPVGNALLGNSIYGNDVDSDGDGIGIDLEGGTQDPTYNWTANDANDGDSGPNALQNFPVLTAATTTGATVTITGSLNSIATNYFRIEFFASAVPTPGPDPGGHGQGQRYLGYVDVTTDGSGNASFSPTLTAPVAVGEAISATATRSNAAFDQWFDTSEFAANVNATGGNSISGTIYHDVDGDADIAEGGTLTFSNATVRLHLDDGDGNIDAADGLVTTTTTDGSGNYSFGSLADGTYYIVIDSTTLAATGYNSGFDINDVWAEQTYAVTGAASGAGFSGADGALYGGRNAGTSDIATAITTAEHVIKITVAGADASGVNAGFSFNAIVNTRGDAVDDDGGGTNRLQQGSLRQFILNANAISGSQTAEFAIGAEGSSQSIAPSSVLPTISDTISLDGWTQGAAGYTGPPLIEIDGTGAGAVSALTFNAASIPRAAR